MKKIALAFVLGCFCFAIQAQNFEGIIKWSMTTNIDPAKKAQMQKDMKGPNADKLNQGIAMMEQRLNDPQINSNPTAKAQLEQQIQMMKAMRDSQSGSGGGAFDAMMPKGFTIKMKNGNTVTTMDGGMASMIGEILHLKDQDKTYSIKRDQKTYSVMPQSSEPIDQKSDAKVTKTDEMTKILNYNCRKYLVTTTDKKGRNVFQTIWATNEIKDIDLKSFGKMKTGDKGVAFIYKEIDGIPLKIENKMEEGNLTMEVVDVKRVPLSNEEFQIPTDFKETQGFGR